MKFGILLPIYDKDGIKKDIDLINIIDNDNVDSIWVRDIPIGQISDMDEGSKVDPFLFINKLARITNKNLGIAVLNTAFRETEVTIREIMTLSLFTNNKIMYGVGAGTKKDVFEHLGKSFQNKNNLFDDWLSKYAKYYYNQKKYYTTSDKVHLGWETDKKLPKLTVATTDIKLLKKHESIIERNIFWFQNAKNIRTLTRELPNIEMNMFISISQVTSNEIVMEHITKGNRSMLKIDINSFSILAKEYETLGIDRLILALDGENGVIDFINNI